MQQPLKWNLLLGVYGVVLAYSTSTKLVKLKTKEVVMIVICAWCQQEGKRRILETTGEKSDGQESHGICQYHFLRLRHEYRRSLFSELPQPHLIAPFLLQASPNSLNHF